MLYKIGKVHFSLVCREWFSCKGKEWKIYCCGHAMSTEPQKLKFHVVVWQSMSKIFSRKRAARAARLFFPRSTNQTLNLWRCRCRCLRHFLNSLIARHAQLAPLFFSLPYKIETCRITSFEILKIMQPHNSELFAKPCAPSLKHNSSE